LYFEHRLEFLWYPIFYLTSLARFEYERELDKQLEAKDITKAQHKKLVSKSWKDFSISQRELGEKTGVSAGKINQLKKDKYSAHILKKSNEKYSKENNIGPLNEWTIRTHSYLFIHSFGTGVNEWTLNITPEKVGNFKN